MNSIVFEKRIKKLKQSMQSRNFDTIIVTESWAIKYLTGIWNEPYERMYALCVSSNQSDSRPVLIANRLFNIPSILSSNLQLFWYTDTQNPVQILRDNVCLKGNVGVDKTWSARFLLPLIDSCPDARFVVDTDCVDSIRAIKESCEIELMEEASRVNDTCMEKAMNFVREHVAKNIPLTEKDVAGFIEKQFLEEGAESPSFETIVSFGEHGADPHHSPDQTLLKKDDVVLIDMGCRKGGYCSDMTRTFFVGNATEEQKKIHSIVAQANLAAEKIVRPGVSFAKIDEAARSYISEQGYGEFFTHRLGHFIGQTDHEAGDVSATNTSLAEPGMIFSIEPGIYLPGKFGVRIEDLVLVTETGCKVLNHVTKNH